MSEFAKTVVFVVAAVASLFIAFVSGTREDAPDVEALIGERINQFDIDAPKRLRIVKYDPETTSTLEFEVAEENGLWVIPSKQDYPADAARHMAEAATSLMDREILRIAATSASEHEELGVVDPSSSSLDSKSEGVGTRVIMSDMNNDVLTDMIIGKEVQNSPGQHYARNSNQDVVFVIEIDPTKLTTRFEDWIEDDLLKLNPLDIRLVDIKDYSAEMMLTLSGFQVSWDRRAEMTLRYDNSESSWHIEQLRKYDSSASDYVPYELAENEELNEEVLQQLRNSLDDLRIVDVERKPPGLSADLKAGEDFLQNQSAAESLMRRGFAPVAIGDSQEANILSTEGEAVCTLQNGVEYVLRFGNLQMESDESSVKSSSGEDSEADQSNDVGINRYLFVMAQFNESIIEKPELEELPELPELPEEDSAEEETTEEDPTEDPTMDETSPEDGGRKFSID